MLAAALRAAEPSPEPDGDNDAKKILGSWQAVKAAKRGTPAPASEVENLKLEVTKDTLTVFEGLGQGLREQSVTYKLDSKPRPRAIDLPRKADPKDFIIRGIYKIEKGELTIVFGDPDGTRPKAFDEKGKNVLVFRKAKAKK